MLSSLIGYNFYAKLGRIMNLESVSASLYLEELALKAAICQKATTNPQQAVLEAAQLSISEIADRTRKAIALQVDHNTPQHFQLILYTLSAIGDEALRSRAAKKVHDSTTSADFKSLIAHNFDFTLAIEHETKRATADQQTLKYLQDAEGYVKQAKLFADIRSGAIQEEAREVMRYKNLVDLGLKEQQKKLSRAAQRERKALDTLQTQKASDVMTTINRIKKLLRRLASFSLPNEARKLKLACQKHFGKNGKL